MDWTTSVMLVGLTYNLKKLSLEDMSSYDDTEAEWDDIETIDALIEALSRDHTVVPIEADENAFSQLRKINPDIVFNVAEGKGGPNRESYIPSILEMLGIPYTGSDPTTLGICLDKSRTKEILSAHNILTPQYMIVTQNTDIYSQWTHFPSLVKPAWEGSSKGIRNSSFVNNTTQMRTEIDRVHNEYSQPALIEEFLPGREFTIAVIGNGSDTTTLPLVEIMFDALPRDAHKIYSYEAKWIWDKPNKPLPVFACPADVSSELASRIQGTALRAFHSLRCRDWCRIDIRLDKNNDPHIIELNPLPGILPNPAHNSCFPKAARAEGINYQDLINKILGITLSRISQKNLAHVSI